MCSLGWSWTHCVYRLVLNSWWTLSQPPETAVCSRGFPHVRDNSERWLEIAQSQICKVRGQSWGSGGAVSSTNRYLPILDLRLKKQRQTCENTNLKLLKQWKQEAIKMWEKLEIKTCSTWVAGDCYDKKYFGNIRLVKCIVAKIEGGRNKECRVRNTCSEGDTFYISAHFPPAQLIQFLIVLFFKSMCMYTPLPP